MFTEVSKSVVDKVIKPGRDSRDNMGWVEAQLKGEDQPELSTQHPPEQGFSTLALLALGAA